MDRRVAWVFLVCALIVGSYGLRLIVAGDPDGRRVGWTVLGLLALPGLVSALRVLLRGKGPGAPGG